MRKPMFWAVFCFIVGVWNCYLWQSLNSGFHLLATLAMAICVWYNLVQWWRAR